jgi:hypothetical protein
MEAKHGGTDVKDADLPKPSWRTPKEGQEVDETYLLTQTKRARVIVRPENEGAVVVTKRVGVGNVKQPSILRSLICPAREGPE